ncbi:hypothetical protein DRE_00116 [Drechslerella stenobrocha 248]|uniref:Histidinol-phosphatase n=1 Tax=Drechslerella stenobrocha 248 TaxID=1043628 RepID=W7HX85_9PEZI|nr:hypothetical protein DRE_00116 [Drechslerella stenobrocha 248]
MPFSHHSHSGQFCAHAKDSLEECVLQAIAKNLRTFCLTEHMPRALARDLYPDELALNYTPQDLAARFAEYYKTAVEMRERYWTRITLLIGFEVDWIRPSMADEVAGIRATYDFDMFVGSVHHVDGVPIDFSKEMYQRAIETVEANDRAAAAATGAGDANINTDRFPEIEVTGSVGEERLFEAYFDTQYAMLKALKPPVVGHFDLIRLMSRDYRVDMTWLPKVHEKLLRNIKFIASYGGLVEVNSAAIRKGWEYPYPGPDVVKLMRREGVRFVLSDDSHGVAQVAYGYDQALPYLVHHGVEEVCYYEWVETHRTPKDGFLMTMVDGQQLPKIGGASIEARKIRIEDLKGILREFAYEVHAR